MKKVDFLIVGQGIAGTILSYHLIKRKKKVLVINNDSVTSSSKVGAGIFNPITGKRLVKTWKAEEIFTYLEPFYKDLENELQIKFMNTKEIYRPFTSIEDQNDCMGRTSLYNLEDYILNISTSGKKDNYINDPFGGITIKHSGFIDIPVMLEGFKRYLLSLDAYKDEIFDEDKLILNERCITYNNTTADKVIYCDGPQSRKGKYFSWLPFKIVKGDLLLIKAEVYIDQIISKGIYVVPLGRGYYKVGATYNWTDSSNNPTQEGKIELCDKLISLLNFPFEVVGHYAGIRPATKDRRPFLGIHPLNKTVAIFNGLGSKGVSLAPFLARHFTEFLIDGKELENNVNIIRYKSLYFN